MTIIKMNQVYQLIHQPGQAPLLCTIHIFNNFEFCGCELSLGLRLENKLGVANAGLGCIFVSGVMTPQMRVKGA